MKKISTLSVLVLSSRLVCDPTIWLVDPDPLLIIKLFLVDVEVDVDNVVWIVGVVFTVEINDVTVEVVVATDVVVTDVDVTREVDVGILVDVTIYFFQI